MPLYTLLQGRSAPGARARVVAANNVMNAVFMVIGSAALAGLAGAGVTAPQMLWVLAGANVLVAVYTYSVVPEFMFRLICWMLAHVVYRLRIEGRSRIPKTGAAVLVCNHVTFVDWLILSAATQRPIRFVMHHQFLVALHPLHAPQDGNERMRRCQRAHVQVGHARFGPLAGAGIFVHGSAGSGTRLPGRAISGRGCAAASACVSRCARPPSPRQGAVQQAGAAGASSTASMVADATR